MEGAGGSPVYKVGAICRPDFFHARVAGVQSALSRRVLCRRPQWQRRRTGFYVSSGGCMPLKSGRTSLRASEHTRSVDTLALRHFPDHRNSYVHTKPGRRKVLYVKKAGVRHALRMLSPRPANHVTSEIDDTMILRFHIAILKGYNTLSTFRKPCRTSKDLHA